MSQTSLFVAYSHKDEQLKDALLSHLGPLRRLGMVKDWHDRKIEPGAVWDEEIDRHLNSADIILLLISADFIASDYCYGIEMERALERHESRQACVIPVILRTCEWHLLAFRKLQALPKDGKPVTKWQDADDALTDIARGIRSMVESIQKTPEPSSLIPTPVSGTSKDGSDELFELLMRFFRKYAGSFFNALKIQMWGARQNGFSTLGTFTTHQIKDAIKYGVSQKVVNTKRSKSGSILYGISKRGH
jgi:hypothetical protein